MKFTHKNQLTCSSSVTFELDDEDVLHNVSFTGGCDGNLKAVSRLAEGMKAEEYVKRCSGVTCGRKPTSCSDQFAKAVLEALEQKKRG